MKLSRLAIVLLVIDGPAGLVIFPLNATPFRRRIPSAGKAGMLFLPMNTRFARIQPVLLTAGQLSAVNALFDPLTLIVSAVVGRIGMCRQRHKQSSQQSCRNQTFNDVHLGLAFQFSE